LRQLYRFGKTIQCIGLSNRLTGDRSRAARRSPLVADRPRIRDVAALAGTSVSTVSNLLNGRPDRMRPETVRRIEEAIADLGYRPSWAARQLKTGFAPVIGLLVPSVANPFHGAMARAVEVAAQARGYQVVLGNSLRDPGRERRYAEDFFDFGIRGVIAGSSPFDLGHFAELMARGLAIVAFDLVTTDAGGAPAIDSVSIDNRKAGYLATRHLIDLGHRRIGYVSGATPTRSRRDRLEGYRQALAESRIVADERLIAAGDGAAGYDDTHAAEHGRAAATELLRSADPPSGLVALNDMHAIGAAAAVRDAGGSVPADVSVVGIDDIPLAGLFNPTLTTVRQPIETLGEAAVDLLVKRLNGDRPKRARHIVFEPHLVVRESSAAPSGRVRQKTRPARTGRRRSQLQQEKERHA
jgi:DNA-binding LacI/PurR family transcriptional regulator